MGVVLPDMTAMARLRGAWRLREVLLALVAWALPCFAVLVFLGVAGPVRGATITWDGGGVTTNWSEAANWSTNTVPSAADVAVFDATSAKPAVINANASVAGLQLNAAYLGSLTQTVGRTLTVGASGYVQNGTAFVGGTSAITVNGPYTLSAGTFTSTGGTLTVTGNLTHTGGTFLPGLGTVQLSGAAATIDVPVTETVNNLLIAAGGGVAKTIAAGDTLVVGGSLTLTNGTVDGGTLAARGNLTQAAGFDGGGGTLRIEGTADQTFTGAATATTGQLPDLVIDKPAGTLSLAGTIRTANDWTYLAGTLDPGVSNVVFAGTPTISGSHTLAGVEFRNAGAKTIAAGTTLTVTGALTLTDGDLNTGVLEAHGPIAQAATFDGETATLRIVGTADQTFTGAATAAAGDLPDVVIDKPSGTLSLAGTIRTANDWTYLAGTLDPGASSVVFVLTPTISGSHALANVEFRGAGAKTVTAGDTLTVNGALTLTDGSLDGGTLAARGNLTQAAGFDGGGGTLRIEGTADQTFTGAATATTGQLPDLVIDKPAGTLSLAGTIRTANDWTYLAGTLDPGASSVVFVLTPTISGSHALANVEFRGAGAKTVTAGDTLTVNGALTLTDGSLDGGTLAARGNLTQAAGFDGGGGTLRIVGTADQTFTGAATATTGQLPDLVIDKPAGTLSLAGTIRTANDWTYLAGTLDPGVSNVVFAGTLTVTNPVPLNDVAVRTGTVTLAAPLTLLGNLTVSSGTLAAAAQPVMVPRTVTVAGMLDITAGVLSVGGDLTITGTALTAGSRVVLIGPSAQVLTLGGNALDDLEVANAGAVSLGGDATVSGTLELTTGAFAVGANTLTIAAPIAGTPTNLVADATSAIAVVGTGASIHVPASVIDLAELTVQNPSGVTLDTSLVVHGTLSLQGGNVIVTPFLVALDIGAVVTRTTGHVVGALQKPIPAGGPMTVTFEVGDLGAYAPVDLAWTSVASSGTLAVATSSGDDPGLAAAGIDPAASVNRSWSLAAVGFAAEPVEVTVHYEPGDLDPGADPALIVAAIGDGVGWASAPVVTRTATSLTVGWTVGASADVVAGMAAADLSLAISGPSALQVRQAGTYVVAAKNNGPQAAGGVAVEIPIPSGVSLGALTATQGTCSVDATTLLCDLGALAPSMSASISIELSFAAEGTYLIAGLVTVSGASDPDNSDDAATLAITVSQAPVATPSPTPRVSPSPTPTPGGPLPDTAIGAAYPWAFVQSLIAIGCLALLARMAATRHRRRG